MHHTKTSLRGVATYMAELRHIHHVFASHHLPHYYMELDTDLRSLELQSQISMDIPPLIQDPYISEYALYIDTLPRHTMLSHWFGLVYPYMQIPDQKILLMHADLPPGWIEASMYFNISDELLIRKQFEDQVVAWRPMERFQFFEESAEVYLRMFGLFSRLYR